MQSKITLPYGYVPEPIFWTENAGSSPNTRSVSILDNTPTSIRMSISVESKVNESIDYRVAYKSANSDWHFVEYDDPSDLEPNEDGGISLSVNNLHPDTEYEFSIFQKLVAAPASDWTYLASFAARTKPCAPYKPPEVVAGSFGIDYVPGDDRRTIRVFWRSVPVLEQNGNGFGYRVKIFEEGRIVDEFARLPSETFVAKEASLKMHEFVVSSYNYYGVSENSSIVRVPAQKDIIRVPVVGIDNSNGSIEMMWNAQNGNKIDQEVLVECDGGCTSHSWTCCERVVEYRVLPKGTTSWTFDNFEVFQKMAIMLQSATSSTGIIRPACLITRDNLGQMLSSPTLMDDEGFQVRIVWPMQCPEQGSIFGILGYNTYLRPVTENEINATPEIKIYTHTNATTLRVNLKIPSHELYQISVAPIWTSGAEGPRSKPVTVVSKNIRTLYKKSLIH